MATGGTPPKEQEIHHTCSLCMEPYRGRNPKILPCFHTFCLPCLTALQDSVTTATSDGYRFGDENLAASVEDEQKQPDSKQDNKQDETAVELNKENKDKESDVTKGENDVSGNVDDEEKNVFLCPTCRAPVTIPEKGVAAFQTNFYLDHEASPEEAPPPAVCDMCEEGSQQHASHVCQQCQLRMCRACKRHHDRFNSGHHVMPVSLGQPEKQRSEKKRLCLVHQDQVLCFHCRQCDVSICLHCKCTSHEGHVTVDLASAVLQARKEVKSLMTSIQQQLQVLESSLRRVERDDRALARDVQQVTQQINARHDVILTWVKQSHDDMLEEVKAKEDSAKGQLSVEKTAITVTMDTLSALFARAARVTGNDPDMVSLRDEVQAALLSKDRLVQYRQQADRKEALWGWKYDVTDASLGQQDEIRAYMGRMVKSNDVTTRSPSLRDLADNITNITSQLTQYEDDLSALKADLQSKTTSLTEDLTKTAASLTVRLTKTASSLKDEIRKTSRMVSFHATCLDTSKTKGMSTHGF